MDHKLAFTALENQKLIKFVAKHPVLYDQQNSMSKGLLAREKAWRKIAEQLGRPGNIKNNIMIRLFINWFKGVRRALSRQC